MTMLIRQSRWVGIAAAGLIGISVLAMLPGTGAPRVPVATNANPVFPPPELVKSKTSASIVPAGTAPPKAEQTAASPKVEAGPATVALPDATQVAQASLAATPDATAMSGTAQVLRVGPRAVNVRAEATSASDKVFVLQPGDQVTADGEAGGWMHITVAGGASGWVYSPYLEGGEAQTADLAGAIPIVDEPTAPPKRIASARSVKAIIQGADGEDLEGRTARLGTSITAKARPSDSAETAMVLEAGERVRIAESRGEWVRVITSDGTSVWIQRAF
jgi:SH3-like domain-containing protein